MGSMHIALVASVFPPQRNSGAVQLRDLSREIRRQGHDLTVFLPSERQDDFIGVEGMEGVKIVRLKAPRTSEVGYVRRTLGELLMPFAMVVGLKNITDIRYNWDGVVWYSPSIFHGPFVRFLMRKSSCRGYLILRDIFPEWAVDVGLMGRGLAYWFFKLVARYQYSIASVIGVQSSGNLSYFKNIRSRPTQRIEVLENWLGASGERRCTIRVADTVLRGRKVFVYAGNMGVAQGVEIFLNLAKRLQQRNDIGFIFVGRGSEAGRLKAQCLDLGLSNTLFFDEIHPDEIPDLYSQCCVGIVSLDPRHRSHNIPGKFLTYMQSGLPVLANINGGNDLVELIEAERVGKVCDCNSIDLLEVLALSLLEEIDRDPQFSRRCKDLFDRKFSVETAVKQIVSGLCV